MVVNWIWCWWWLPCCDFWWLLEEPSLTTRWSIMEAKNLTWWNTKAIKHHQHHHHHHTLHHQNRHHPISTTKVRLVGDNPGGPGSLWKPSFAPSSHVCHVYLGLTTFNTNNEIGLLALVATISTTSSKRNTFVTTSTRPRLLSTAVAQCSHTKLSQGKQTNWFENVKFKHFAIIKQHCGGI